MKIEFKSDDEMVEYVTRLTLQRLAERDAERAAAKASPGDRRMRAALAQVRAHLEALERDEVKRQAAIAADDSILQHMIPGATMLGVSRPQWRDAVISTVAAIVGRDPDGTRALESARPAFTDWQATPDDRQADAGYDPEWRRHTVRINPATADAQTPERMRYIVAHELAHVALDHHRQAFSGANTAQMEREADDLARFWLG